MPEDTYISEKDLEKNLGWNTGIVQLAEKKPTPLSVVKIYTSPYKGEPMVEQKEVTVIEGKGIVGDRYFLDSITGYFKDHGVPNCERAITLISLEGIEEGNKALQEKGGTPLRPEETRRNLIVNVSLNDLTDLMGQEFEVGGIRMRGLAPSTPCWRPPSLADRPKDITIFVNTFLHKTGIRAIPLNSGIIREGDSITLPKTEPQQ